MSCMGQKLSLVHARMVHKMSMLDKDFSKSCSNSFSRHVPSE
jgi:hypothetical protein